MLSFSVSINLLYTNYKYKKHAEGWKCTRLSQSQIDKTKDRTRTTSS